MKIGWKTRVAIVLSAIWMCLVFLVADDYQRFTQILGVGLLPLVLLWGLGWAIAGWKSQRRTKRFLAPQPMPTVPAEPELAAVNNSALHAERARSDRRQALKVFSALAILMVGLFAAAWQSGGTAGVTSFSLGRLVGEWLLLGLIAFAILRALPKVTSGVAAIVTALVIAGAVNYKAYVTVSEDNAAIDSLAKAAPLLNKLHAGHSISSDEVRSADVGLLEPLVLAHAAYVRDVSTVASHYQKSLDALEPEMMLTPASLASAGMRAQTRERLKLWRQAAHEHRTQFDLATARNKSEFRAAVHKLPSRMEAGTSAALEVSNIETAEFAASSLSAENEGISAISALLDFMDKNADSYALDTTPPEKLLFTTDTELNKYRELMAHIIAAGQREQEITARLSKAQLDRVSKIASPLKR